MCWQTSPLSDRHPQTPTNVWTRCQSKKNASYGENVTKGETGTKKTPGHDITKGLKVIMGRNVIIFIGKMDVKYIRLKCNHGTKCHTVRLAEIAVTECSPVTFHTEKVFKNES